MIFKAVLCRSDGQMATLASFSPHLILHRFIRRAAISSHANKSFPRLGTASHRFIFSSGFSLQSAVDVSLLENVETESEGEIEAVSVSESLKKSSSEVIKRPPPPPPSLSVKEKKELGSYAHSLGKKLKSQQVGKSGVTDTVVGALIETLEANELLKLKIHGSCPGELEDVVRQIEESTGSVVVGQIGRTVILYRPSLSKLKAEEKKKQFQRDFLKRQAASKPFPQSRRAAAVAGEEPRQTGRGRRGGSRF